MKTFEEFPSMQLIPEISAIAEEMFLYAVETGYMEGMAEFKLNTQKRGCFLIFYVFEKMGKLLYDNIEYDLKEGSMIFIDCEKDFEIYSTYHKGLNILYLCFSGRHASSYYNLYSSLNPPVTWSEYKILFASLLWQIITLHSDNDLNAEIITSSIITKLLTELCIREDDSVQEKDYPEYIKKVFHYIEHHYVQKITISELAIKVSVSKAHLSREFKRYTGRTINDYIRQIRLNSAKMLLRHTNKTLYDISMDVGFCSTSHFINVFHRKERITPQKYRDQWLK